MCNFGNGVQVLDDIDSPELSGDLRIVAGNSVNLNFIRTSVGAIFESFPLVYLAYTDRNANSYITGVSKSHNMLSYTLFIILSLSFLSVNVVLVEESWL